MLRFEFSTLEEQSMLLTTEPFLQPPTLVFRQDCSLTMMEDYICLSTHSDPYARKANTFLTEGPS